MVDGSVFSCLPIAVRDSLLQQAFQQLDQRHLFGLAPRVCRLWYQLSLKMITSLDVTISTPESAEQLNLWVTNHGASLQHLSLDMAEPVCRRTSELQPLFKSVETADQLRSLNISIARGCNPVLDLSLTMLTKLTSLRIKGCDASGGTLRESIPHATTLRSLSLDSIDNLLEWGTFMQQVSTSLVYLTCLELNGVFGGILATDIAVLRALPQLQQLQLKCLIPARHLSKLGSLPFTVMHIYMCDEGEEADVCNWLQQSATNLRELFFFSGCCSSRIPVPPLAPLQQALQLRDLIITGLRPSMTEVAALAQLTRLALEYCALDDRAVCRLSSLSALRELSLFVNKGVSGAEGSMEVLANSMPQLTSLNLVRTNAWESAKHAFVSRKVGIQR